MAQAARQLYDNRSYSSQTARAAQPGRVTRPNVRVIPGRKNENPAFQSISPEMVYAFKLVLVVVAVLAALCAVRVWLSASTVAMLESTNKLESTLITAQASTNELEIQHSILASPSRIEEEATNIGMKAPDSVQYIRVVVPGRVILNSDGSISLAGTLRNIEEYYASTTV